MTANINAEPSIVGRRLKTAREHANLTVAKAATALGFRTPLGLAKVEEDPYSRSVSVELIRDAAKLYQVTADYLLGLSDAEETPESQMDILIAHFEGICRRRESLMLQIKQFKDGLPPSGKEWQALAKEALALGDDLKSLCRISDPPSEQGGDEQPQQDPTPP